MIFTAVVAAGAVTGLSPFHALGDRFSSPLPLVAYLAGACAAVAASILIALRREAPESARSASRVTNASAPRPLPRGVERLFGAAGLLGWIWIGAVLLFGGSEGERVDDLLLWVYGWVGIAYLSMLHPDVWAAIDPNRRIARLVRTLLRRTTDAAPGPARRFDGRTVGVAALVGVVLIIWLELVATGGGGGAILLYAHALLAGWVITGRVGASDADAWAAANDPLTAWFSMIGALRLRGVAWGATGAILASVAAGSVIFDGLSQGQLFFVLFGVPAAAERTILLLAWLAAIVLLAVITMRLAAGRAWATALGEGLLPVAAGYLVAHYASWLLIAGQRIVVAVGDPLQRGSDYFGTAWFEPSGAFIPGAAVWALQLVAVIGGHVLGVSRGHAAVLAARHADGSSRRALLLAQIPLAIFVLALTLVTLWSLGQVVVAAAE